MMSGPFWYSGWQARTLRAFVQPASNSYCVGGVGKEREGLGGLGCRRSQQMRPSAQGGGYCQEVDPGDYIDSINARSASGLRIMVQVMGAYSVLGLGCSLIPGVVVSG